MAALQTKFPETGQPTIHAKTDDVDEGEQDQLGDPLEDPLVQSTKPSDVSNEPERPKVATGVADVTKTADKDGPGHAPSVWAKGAMNALQRGDLGELLKWATEEPSVADVVVGAMRAGKLTLNGEDEVAYPGAMGAFQALLKDGVDGLSGEQKDYFVTFCGNLSRANQVQLFNWLEVPLQTEGRGTVTYDDDRGIQSTGGDFLGEEELPLVLQGLLQLPSRFWRDPKALKTYTGIRPGPAAAYVKGSVTAVSLDERTKKVKDGAAKVGKEITDKAALEQGKQAFADGVSHEIGHSIDAAMPGAHKALMAALGFERLAGADAFVKRAGMLDGVSDAGAIKCAATYVDLWMKNSSHPSTKDGVLEQLSSLGESMKLEDVSKALDGTYLLDVLVASNDPTSIEKTDVGGKGYALFQKAGEYQVFGAAMKQHLTAWGNGKAALSDREYCAELFRCYFQAPAAERAGVLAGYPPAAQAWIAKAEAFGKAP